MITPSAPMCRFRSFLPSRNAEVRTHCGHSLASTATTPMRPCLHPTLTTAGNVGPPSVRPAARCHGSHSLRFVAAEIRE